jgi:hypothetical protein
MLGLPGRSGWAPPLVAIAVIGCGGGAGPLSSAGQPTYKSASFSPTTAMDDGGRVAPEIWWRLRVNGGDAASFVTEGKPGTAKLDDIEIRLPSASLQRTTTMTGSLTIQDPSLGTETSTFREDTVDTLGGGPPAAISRETVHDQQSVRASIRSASLDLTGVTTPTVPLTQFADRTDLDQLPVGHIDELDYMSTTALTGTVSAGGQFETSSSSETDMIRETWTVTAQLPSMTVLDTTYTRVVQMERQIDKTDTSTGALTTLSSTLFFAAGIGLVHGISVQTDIPELAGVPTDLVDTNLRQ